MKIIFAGTPLFAAAALDALVAAGHDIALVLTQPDKAAGRGMKTAQSPVKMLAEQRGLSVFQPGTLKNSPEIERMLDALHADVMVVAAYGLILPAAILEIPRLGCINIHASILPRWRGAAPIQRAILTGDAATGITLMQMDAGLDTGDIIDIAQIPIQDDDTGASLHDKLAELGAKSIVGLLSKDPGDRFHGKKQDDALATYAAKLSKSESSISWADDARQIERQVRAFDPFPGAACLFEETPIKIWKARLVEGVNGAPGEVLNEGTLLVACGKDGLELEVLQKPGGKRLHVKQFLPGFPIPAGSTLR